MVFPKIELSGKENVDTLVLGWFQAPREEGKKSRSRQNTPPQPPEFLGKKNPEIEKLLGQLKDSGHFNGRKNETNLLRYYSLGGYPNVLLLGLGRAEQWDNEVARQCGAALYLAQRRARLTGVLVDGESVFGNTPKENLSYFLQAFCEGYLLAGYEFVDLKQDKPKPAPTKLLQFTRLPKDNSLKDAVKKAQVLADSICFARSLGDRPGNYATPDLVAQLVQKKARESGLKCTVFNKARILKEKMGLFWGVAKGSSEEPRFIILEHNRGKKSDPPIALIGKGVTFDTGGISLKPPTKMEEMKYDMMGSATVAGIMMAVSQLKLPINVHGYIAAAENMPGGDAQKPGDIAVSLTGKTVEIINTDAEGRLLLADAIEYVQKTTKPQCMIDFATLTGAVVVALGSCATGIMGTHKGLIKRIEESSEATQEKVWELPLFPEYEDFLRSPVADIKNASDVREAGSSKGGTFLKFFVDKKIPWVHCDIAGSGMTRRDKNYNPSRYGAGVMIRLMAHLIENWKPLRDS